MNPRRHTLIGLAAALALGWAGAAGAATAAQECEVNKLKASSDKAKCLLRAETDSVLSEKPPKTARCVAGFTHAFASAEAKAGGECPTVGDVDDIEALIDACVADVAEALSGSPPPPCQQFPTTGQTTVHQPGDDGHIQAGTTLSYTDTGKGTIIDNNTGLEWEKQTDDRAAEAYSWDSAFRVADFLNRPPCYAGHCDWRLPNVKELQSIVDYGRFNPSIDPIFGPTIKEGYWSSTTFAGTPTVAWVVNFESGTVNGALKGDIFRVRVVRGGTISGL